MHIKRNYEEQQEVQCINKHKRLKQIPGGIGRTRRINHVIVVIVVAA
jgi:hypothetical protein